MELNYEDNVSAEAIRLFLIELRKERERNRDKFFDRLLKFKLATS